MGVTHWLVTSERCLVPFHDKCLVAGLPAAFVMIDIRRRTRLPTLGMTGDLRVAWGSN